jgi:hypothetical protein
MPELKPGLRTSAVGPDLSGAIRKGSVLMPALASAIDNLTLSITEEILVRASIEKTFASLLEQLGPAN